MTRQELYQLADAKKGNMQNQGALKFGLEEKEMLTEEILKQVHQLIGGTGLYRQGELVTSTIGICPPHGSELERLMGHFISQLQISKRMFHPIEYATICHKRILELCPFEDKNEEVAFLILNGLLVQAGYKAIAIAKEERENYVAKLQAAQHPSHPDIDELITFITQHVVQA